MRNVSYYWFLVMACLLYLVPITSNFYALTAWAAPPLLLMYIYKENMKRAAPLALASVSIVMIISNREIIPGGLAVVSITVLVSVAMLIVLLLLSKWVVNHSGPLQSVLFFPLLMTSFEYFSSYGSVFGTFNSTAYSQLDIKPVAIWASVFGIWGIVFVQYMLASLLAYAYKSGLLANAWRNKRFASIALSGMLLFIGVGALLVPGQAQTTAIQAAGVTPDRVLWDDTVKQLIDRWGTTGFTNEVAGPSLLADQIRQINEGLFERTTQELDRGASLAGWSEGAAIIREQEEEAFFRRLSSLSTTYQSVVVAGYIRVNASDNGKMDNKLVIVDADGSIQAEYSKYSLVPGEERYFNKGRAPVPVVQTAIGTIAAAICFDADFPHRMLEAGLQNPDVLILPSSDWEAITPYHTKISAFRAIENRMVVMRITHGGLSAIYDVKGSMIAGVNDWDYEQGSVLSSKLPLFEQKQTLYKTTGDLLPLLSGAAALLLLAGVIVKAIMGQRARRALNR